MFTINLKKRKRTLTPNNNYDILPVITGKKTLNPIGSYNQSTNIITLNVETLIQLISKGAKFSTKFQKIFLRSTGLLIKTKNIKIKY